MTGATTNARLVRVSYEMDDRQVETALSQFAAGVREVEFPAGPEFLGRDGVVVDKKSFLGPIAIARNDHQVEARRLSHSIGFGYGPRVYPVIFKGVPYRAHGVVRGTLSTNLQRYYNRTVIVLFAFCALVACGLMGWARGHAWIVPLAIPATALFVWPIYVTNRRLAKILLHDARMMAKHMES